MKHSMLAVLALLPAACAVSRAPDPSLYDRVAERLASRPDLEHLGEPPAEMQRVTWMIGIYAHE